MKLYSVAKYFSKKIADHNDETAVEAEPKGYSFKEEEEVVRKRPDIAPIPYPSEETILRGDESAGVFVQIADNKFSPQEATFIKYCINTVTNKFINDQLGKQLTASSEDMDIIFEKVQRQKSSTDSLIRKIDNLQQLFDKLPLAIDNSFKK